MKRIIGIIWINLGIAAILFETVYVLATGKSGAALVVWVAGLAMLWQGIMMVRRANSEEPKDKSDNHVPK